MKQIVRKPLLIILAAALMAPMALLAQTGDKDKEKTKEKEKKDSEVITIIRKGESNEKVVVEVNGDKVTVNGKPVEDYKGDDITVKRTKVKDSWGFGGLSSTNQNWALSGDNFKAFAIDSNRAMLGVTTEKTAKGAQIQDITKESGAAKAGLKEGDVITKIDDKKIESSDDLSKVIKSHKLGDKVTVTYLRDDKEQKVTAELGRWKGASAFTVPGQYNLDLGDFDMGAVMPKIQSIPRERIRGYNNQVYNYSGSSPKLGLSVQDTDEGKGVKVIEVDEESNASKAGLKEGDVITEVEGKATNSADEVAKIIKESKDKNSVMVKLTRAGKTHNIEVKIPRKLKTADL